MPEILDDEWHPVGEDDKAIKDAFGKVLIEGPNSFVKGDPESSSFILRTKGYYDLQLYVLGGIRFPDSDRKFESVYPKKGVQVLEDIDAGIHEFTRDTVVAIAQHCEEFVEKGLGRLTTLASGTITYAEEAMGLLKLEGETSFKDQIPILLDPKYKTQPKDDEFKEALEGATMVLNRLRAIAKEKQEDTQEVVTLLTSFRDGPVIDRITKEKRIDKNGQPIKPFTKLLDAEIIRLQEEIEKEIERASYERDVMSKHEPTAFAAAEGDIIGIIMDAYTYNLAEKKYHEMLELEKTHTKEKTDVRRYITMVRALLLHMETLVPQMAKALEAAEELQELFKTQADNFDKLRLKLAGIQEGVDAQGLKWRKAWITTNIDKSVQKLEEIKQAALAFDKTAKIKVVEG
ncbi:uncharacterized protein NFIA_002470 [Aspergillus fischeri NRRL 181]|uniref:Uncharacterized protein n=1 Tax=Neosartorya fischeri (strain ATCC 1020 / DSM 3700 / CBS 544.65 / FGSC A1164 / JCM 1740 / NRRL 181 / WB 181) TaxID=331117 RepID=A1DJK8_NEOFI|nr:uncharacterized protein NFIA_002470 [Aspergillus fischeri NRRL 181]EAW16897.1 hypothetical protein NFIA_002470 [Aspergillus fischeri NRRL 181]KAG2019092.1 hypothetical protein GB937_005383 [Aspergillus fischeri]